jgi:general stress protein 26
MDSINANQPEQNHQDLTGRQAIDKIREIVKKSPNCFFCTAGENGQWSAARPMNVRDVDEAGNLWFLSADDSHKNEQLGRDPRVRLYFQGSTHSEFLHIDGAAAVYRNKATIKELWEPILKTWFTEGIDDPRITAIRVTPSGGYYWDNKHGNLIAGVKMMIGAMIGKTLDDSIEGKVEVRH